MLYKGAGLTGAGIEVRDEGFLVTTGLNRNGLVLWTGDFGRFVFGIELDREL